MKSVILHSQKTNMLKQQRPITRSCSSWNIIGKNAQKIYCSTKQISQLKSLKKNNNIFKLPALSTHLQKFPVFLSTPTRCTFHRKYSSFSPNLITVSPSLTTQTLAIQNRIALSPSPLLTFRKSNWTKKPLFKVPDSQESQIDHRIVQILKNSNESHPLKRFQPLEDSEKPEKTNYRINKTGKQIIKKENRSGEELKKQIDQSGNISKGDYRADTQKRLIQFQTVGPEQYETILKGILPPSALLFDPEQAQAARSFDPSKGDIERVIYEQHKQALQKALYSKHWAKLDSVMMKMKEAGLHLRIDHLMKLVSHYSAIPNVARAQLWFFEIFASGRRPDRVTFAHMLRMYAHTLSWAKCVALFERMKQLEIPPDAINYHYVIMCLSNAGHLSLANHYIDELREKIPWEEVKWVSIYSNLICCYCKIETPKQIFEKINEYEKKIDEGQNANWSSLFHQWIGSALRAYRPQTAIEIFEFARDVKKIQVTGYLFSSLIGALGIHMCPDPQLVMDTVKYIYSLPERKRKVLDQRDLHHMVRALLKIGRYQEISKFYKYVSVTPGFPQVSHVTFSKLLSEIEEDLSKPLSQPEKQALEKTRNEIKALGATGPLLVTSNAKRDESL